MPDAGTIGWCHAGRFAAPRLSQWSGCQADGALVRGKEHWCHHRIRTRRSLRTGRLPGGTLPDSNRRHSNPRGRTRGGRRRGSNPQANRLQASKPQAGRPQAGNGLRSSRGGRRRGNSPLRSRRGASPVLATPGRRSPAIQTNFFRTSSLARPLPGASSGMLLPRSRA